VLSSLRFAPSYSSDVDDLAKELYLPAMSSSVAYDRISGFFSSAVLVVAWPALRQFVEGNSGRIRVLCSPRLAAEDAEGIVFGYRARDEAQLAETLRHELESMLAEPHLRRPAHLLSALIASNVIDVRLATVTQSAGATNLRMFHDKVGIFTDAARNRVGFRGTFNETYLGLARDGNVESVDVWTSWEGGKDASRLDEAVARFETLWEGRSPGVEVVRLPDATLAQLKELARQVDLRSLLADFEVHRTPSLAEDEDWSLGRRTLRPHQRRAVEAWRRNSRRGLLAHATGSGKTVTALFCIREALQRGLRPIVVVPSKLLLEQWDDEVRSVLGIRTVLCGGGHNRWRDGLVRAALGDDQDRVVIAVAASV